MPDEIKILGKLVLKKFGEGSKSEHTATYLASKNDMYLMRRQGGNPFNDPVLKSLIGKSVSAKGILTGNLFLAKEVTEEI